MRERVILHVKFFCLPICCALNVAANELIISSVLRTKSMKIGISNLLVTLALIPMSANCQALSDGFYNEYFLGAKSGGSSFHSGLAESLREKANGLHVGVACINGPDMATMSVVALEQYRKKHPVIETTKKCDGSSSVLVGPFLSLEDAKSNFHDLSGVMLHAIENCIFECKGRKCVIVYK